MSGAVTGLLLAGGSARRFGANKLCARLPDGSGVGVRAAGALAAAGLARVVVVVRTGDALTREAFRGAGYETVECDAATRGMAHTLGCGLAAAPDAAAWLVALADMPFVDPATVRSIVAAYGRTNAIVVPCFDEREGHPVLFPRRYGPELAALTGDVGARAVLDAHADETEWVTVSDPGVLQDIDAPQDLAAPGSSGC